MVQRADDPVCADLDLSGGDFAIASCSVSLWKSVSVGFDNCHENTLRVAQLSEFARILHVGEISNRSKCLFMLSKVVFIISMILG